MCLSLPLLSSGCILELRRVTRAKASINDLSRSTSVFVLHSLFIFAVCLLVFEQYLVKWECSLGAIAVQEIITSARYPAEISFLILFYWRKILPFFFKYHSAYKVLCSYSIWNTTVCFPWRFMIKTIVTEDLLLRRAQEGGLQVVFHSDISHPFLLLLRFYFSSRNGTS